LAKGPRPQVIRVAKLGAESLRSDSCCRIDGGLSATASLPRPPSAERGVQNSCPKSTSRGRRIFKVLRLPSLWDICSATLAFVDQFRHAN
jgi:hypothetical protein